MVRTVPEADLFCGWTTTSVQVLNKPRRTGHHLGMKRPTAMNWSPAALMSTPTATRQATPVAALNSKARRDRNWKVMIESERRSAQHVGISRVRGVFWQRQFYRFHGSSRAYAARC